MNLEKTGDEPRFKFWSTRSSINHDILSVTAIIETAFAITIYWWAAIRFETYLPLLVSSMVAPLVLLRSAPSIKLGVHWFMSFEEKIWTNNRPLSELAVPQQAILGTALLVAMIISVLSIITLDQRLFSGIDISAAFFRGLVVNWLSFIWISVATTIFVTSPLIAFRIASILTLLVIVITEFVIGNSILTAAAAGTGAGTLLLVGNILLAQDYKMRPFRKLLFSLFMAPYAIGIPATIFLVSLIIRIAATLRYICPGMLAMPQNFRRLVLCTSPLHEPELLPNLGEASSQFTAKQSLRIFREKLRTGDKMERLTALIFYPFGLVIWFLPAWFYRLTLKSTAWLWWPLAFLGNTPHAANNPEWFYRRFAEARLSKHLRSLSIFSLLIFLTMSIWRTLGDGKLPENPFLSVVGYAFSIDWSTTPWQLLGVAGSILSIATIYLVDLNYRKYRVAIDTCDKDLADSAIRNFRFVERLERLRTLLFLTYCVIVGLHAFLIFNSQSCWFSPTQGFSAKIQLLYGRYSPAFNCVRDRKN